MLYRYQYETPEEREIIIQNNKNLTLFEEQNITEGNFLVFTDNIPVTNQDILTLMDGIATTFEELLALRTIVEQLWKGGTV